MQGAYKPPHEFKALELKITEQSKDPHYIFFKEHSIREQNEDKPSGRTMFIVNVPPYADETGIKNAFSEAGNITSVQLMLKPAPMQEEDMKFITENTKASFRIGYVVFSKVVELDNALKLTKLNPMNSEEHQIKYGMAKLIADYNNNVLQPFSLKQEIDEFIKIFDEKTKDAEAKEKKLEQEDEEGWVTVTRRSKVTTFSRTETVENIVMAKEAKGKQRKELQNFYTFQIRESKMRHIVSLRQKFEEDKRKIASIKESRRFKPF